MFRFKCASCGEWHEGMPGFGASAPLYYYIIPEAERSARSQLTTDTCIGILIYFVSQAGQAAGGGMYFGRQIWPLILRRVQILPEMI